MRIFPIFTAIFVATALYFVVLDRERLKQISSVPHLALMQQESSDAEPVTQTPESAENTTARSDKSGAAGADAPVAVVVHRSTSESIDTVVTVRGQTQAVRQVDVRAQTSAQVISEPRLRGALVAQDDILCELEPGSSRATLAEWQARLEEARINYRAADRLSAEGFTSESRHAAMRSALQSAEAAVDLAELQITYLTIRAPFGGVLETDTAELGALLRPGDLCAAVILLDPILLVGFIPETQIDRVEIGAAAAARLATGTEISGEVTFVARAADPNTRTFRVEITAPNPDLAIRDGQTAEIVIEAAGTNAHFLPGSVLTLNNDGVLGVRTVDAEHVVRFNPVQLLRDTVDGVWLGGLPDEADVIVVGQEYVIEGVRVTPTLRDIAR
jgi:multidrug efflux system membrane fusion protein